MHHEERYWTRKISPRKLKYNAEVLIDLPCYCTFTGKKCWSQSLTVEEHPWEFSKQSPKQDWDSENIDFVKLCLTDAAMHKFCACLVGRSV